MLDPLKKSVKSLLQTTGLRAPVERLYYNLRTASWEVLREDWHYRTQGAPDGLPVPPPDLIYQVIACRWASVYYTSGLRLVNDMSALLARHRYTWTDFEDVLDFGCGCGRMLRHLVGRTPATLYGSDYNPELIQWCRAHLPAEFTVNELAPPLPHAEASFDFIYARSVLTHLTAPLQKAWMQALHRVLRPGGLLYVTTHGRPMTGGLTPAQKAAFEANRLVETYPEVAGANLCSVFQTRAHVQQQLLRGFSLLDFVEGRPIPHLTQDIYLLKKQN